MNFIERQSYHGTDSPLITFEYMTLALDPSYHEARFSLRDVEEIVDALRLVDAESEQTKSTVDEMLSYFEGALRHPDKLPNGYVASFVDIRTGGILWDIMSNWCDHNEATGRSIMGVLGAAHKRFQAVGPIDTSSIQDNGRLLLTGDWAEYRRGAGTDELPAVIEYGSEES